MMNYDGIEIYSKMFGRLICKPLKLPLQCTFVIIVSILCGYPLGAKYACDLYEQKLIDLKTCQRLINIASNASPLFIIGSVGTSMLGSSHIGYILLISNYLSCLVMGIILPGKAVNQKVVHNILTNNRKNIGNIVKTSIDNSITTCLSIGGFVILFSVITSIIKSNILFDIAVKNINLLTSVNIDLISGTLLGLIEMTNGCYLISIASIDLYIKVISISFLLSFSGLSIISQVYSFTYKYNLSMKKYILRKIVQGFIGSVISIVIYKNPIFNFSVQTFSIKHNNNYTIHLIFIIILLLIPYIFRRFNKLFHTS
ncbi:sporulation integral membrane protein YlbJ [Clostridiales bacterium oral taxon 876 str. F0540]|nr:sporulation integral membrane protein YlbJ [Clostridiales bacterium oral taxon 876 str. F0540]